MKRLKLLILFIALLFFLFACDSLNFPQSEDSIQIIETTIAETYDIDAFDLSSIELQVTKKNGSIEIVPLKPEMLSTSDLNKLSTPGLHIITITYLNSEITIRITMTYSELKTNLLGIYEVYAASQGSSLTYDEWINSIKGEDGVSIIGAVINAQGHLILTFCNDEVVDVGKVIGDHAREVLLRIEDDCLEWQYEGDSEWKILVELASLIGPIGQTGTDGKEATFRMGTHAIEWQYVGETTWIQLMTIDSLIGPMGVGITEVSINALGEMIITYSDETTQNLGPIYTSYIVQFKDDEGYVLDTQQLVYGADAIAPAAPQKEGYLFLRWDKEYTNITTDLIITAVYSIETYTVTFEPNGGSDCGDITDVDFGSTIELPIPVKDGFIFSGWYRSNLITASPFYDDSLVKSDLVLYARWSAQDYYIQFIDDDQTILSTQYIKHEATVVQPLDPIRLGYKFIGWYLDETFTLLYDFKQKPNASIDLYAQWALITYQIAYELNLGSSLDDLPDTYSVLTETILLLEPTRLGYEFLGWYNDAEFTGDPITEISQGSTGDLTLYANWNLIRYTITYALDGGENSAENPTFYTMFDFAITVVAPIKNGYIFSGWTMNPDFYDHHQDTKILRIYTFMHTSNVTLYAHWELAEFSVVYDLNGGVNNPNNINSFTMLSESFMLLDPTRLGCLFLGWYNDSLFEYDPIIEIPSGDLKDIYLYAKWEVFTYSIFYTLNEGMNHADNPETYHADLENFILFNPERQGYTFLGWYDNALFENEAVSSFEPYLGNDVTFYAKWELTTYDIFYELGEGINDPLNPISFTLFSENLELFDASKEGYTFMGWYDNAEFSGMPISSISNETDHSIVLYAKWEMTYYEIIYHLNEGFNDYNNPASYTFFAEDIQLYEPYKAGYTFTGWFENSTFSGEPIVYILSGTSGNISIYAKWDLIIYNITYVLDGGTNHDNNPQTYHIEMENIELYDAENTIEWRFEGWYYENTHYIFEATYIDVSQQIDIILYALWVLRDFVTTCSEDGLHCTIEYIN